MAILDKDSINAFLEKYTEWNHIDNSIQKEFVLKDFSSAVALTVRMGIEAEKLGHHPDILLHSWNKVKVTLSTHSEGGLTNKDLELADIFEEL